MRIYVSSMAHPKRLAKRFAKQVCAPLHQAQYACAFMFGYKDWHELEKVTGAGSSPPSKPDWLLPTEIIDTRRKVFAGRLSRLLESWTEDQIWDLLEDLDPTGTMPNEDIFSEQVISEIFPVSWQRMEGAGISVGQAGSRCFENTIKKGLDANKHQCFSPEDRFGYRIFVADFGKGDYPDIKSEAPGVAMIPIRFIPTISEGVLLELDLSLHPAALVSMHFNEDDVDFLAEAIVEYLRDSGIWALSPGIVCGAANGILVTLSGHISQAPVQAVMDALNTKLCFHSAEFDPDDEDNDESQEFLPIRDVVYGLNATVSDKEREAYMLALHGSVFVQHMVRRTIALSKLPQMLERILVANGFPQYAEFCAGMSMATLADRQKLSAFIRSMERAKALSSHVSIFFRDHIVDLLISDYERSQGISFEDISDDNIVPVDDATVAAMARSLGDDELAVLVEENREVIDFAIAKALIDLEGLIEEFAQS